MMHFGCRNGGTSAIELVLLEEIGGERVAVGVSRTSDDAVAVGAGHLRYHRASINWWRVFHGL